MKFNANDRQVCHSGNLGHVPENISIQFYDAGTGKLQNVTVLIWVGDSDTPNPWNIILTPFSYGHSKVG